MKRVGYVSLSDKDIRGGMVLGSYAYFVTSAKPASVLRCPTLDMFHGDTFHPVEVSLALGEHSVQAVVADEVQEHLLLGTYTQPGRVVKLSVPDMTRSASLLLPREASKRAGVEHGLLLSQAHDAAMRGAPWSFSDDPEKVHRICALLSGLAMLQLAKAKQADGVFPK